MKRVLSIAGSDSGGCAGIQADIKAISACGAFAMTAIVAVTSQNTIGVTHIEKLSHQSIITQIDAVLSDIGADAVKSGMLFSSDIIEIVAEKLKNYNINKYILDPVIISASGAKLLEDSAVESVISKLIPLSYVVMPNKHEAETLTGIAINNDEDVKKTCIALHKMGAKNVIIKGGHIGIDNANDVLYDGSDFKVYTADKVDTINVHGTGCTYASALSAYIAQGYDIYEATNYAKQYIAGAILAGSKLNIGGKGAGPVHHFYKCYND